MTTSKSNGAYDTLISLRDKLTCLNSVITPEAVDKLEDELGGFFTVTISTIIGRENACYYGWTRPGDKMTQSTSLITI